MWFLAKWTAVKHLYLSSSMLAKTLKPYLVLLDMKQIFRRLRLQTSKLVARINPQGC